MADKFMLHPDSGKFLLSDAGKFAVAEDCCYAAGEPCEHCDTTPLHFTVVFSGIALCDCPDVNAPYPHSYLDHVEGDPNQAVVLTQTASPCIWAGELAGTFRARYCEEGCSECLEPFSFTPYVTLERHSEHWWIHIGARDPDEEHYPYSYHYYFDSIAVDEGNCGDPDASTNIWGEADCGVEHSFAGYVIAYDGSATISEGGT